MTDIWVRLSFWTAAGWDQFADFIQLFVNDHQVMHALRTQTGGRHSVACRNYYGGRGEYFQDFGWSYPWLDTSNIPWISAIQSSSREYEICRLDLEYRIPWQLHDR